MLVLLLLVVVDGGARRRRKTKKEMEENIWRRKLNGDTDRLTDRPTGRI